MTTEQWQASRNNLKDAKRWVIKIGSALLTNDGKGLNREGMQSWVDQIAGLLNVGHEVVLVSSGSVAEGMTRLGWKTRPDEVHKLQAAAAVGQMGLVQAYETSFSKHGRHTAQVLLTHDDLSDRKRYLNARTTLRTLLDMGVVPIINENDTVVTDEICFGDNDTLGALAANLVEADLLVILTDQDGLYTADPRSNPDATLIFEGMASDPQYAAMAGGGGALGRGGMVTKVRAATLASRSGADTLIVGGRINN
ncbi:MAG: glutamate 5-kinase, partial [Pseudomonadota bacterium]|nr:glutamate 5-kinase [Pseudomonadota bacterium]